MQIDIHQRNVRMAQQFDVQQIAQHVFHEYRGAGTYQGDLRGLESHLLILVLFAVDTGKKISEHHRGSCL